MDLSGENYAPSAIMDKLINEGHNADCLMSIGVTNGVYSREELIPHRPTHLVSNLRELIEIVKQYESALMS